MKRRSLYSLLATVAVFSFISEAFCGKTDLSNFTDLEKYGYYVAKYIKHLEKKPLKASNNYRKAYNCLLAHKRKCDLDTQFEEATVSYQKGCIQTGLSKFMALAGENYSKAFAPLVQAYMDGKNIPGGTGQVFNILEKASYSFNAEADFLLGELHCYRGRRFFENQTAENKEKRADAHFTMAYAAYEKAAKRGFEGAEEKLKNLLTSGKVTVSPLLTIPESPFGDFEILPPEIIAKTIGYLELSPLFSLGTTSPRLYEFVRGEETVKVKKEFAHFPPREDQGFDNLPLFLLLRMLRLVKEDSENIPSFKDWLQRCPEEKLNALIPTLEMLDIFSSFSKSLFPNRPVDESSSRFIKKAFFTDKFPMNVLWFSEQNYKKLTPFHVSLYRKFPEIRDILTYDTLEKNLKHKMASFNDLVHLTQEQCVWLSKIIPPRSAKLEGVYHENQRYAAIWNYAESIIRFFVNHEGEDQRFKSLYDLLPESLGWERFGILATYIAQGFNKIEDARIYEKFLKEVKEVLESERTPEEKLKLLAAKKEAIAAMVGALREDTSNQLDTGPRFCPWSLPGHL